MSTAVTAPITGPEAWQGSELAGTSDWIHPFTPAAVSEIDAALRAVERRGLRWPAFERADFPLPAVAPWLARALDELEDGRGLVLLRGFPVERYTEDELRQLYWGLGLHLGTARPQNATGELIGEVRDEVQLYGEVREVPGASSVMRSSRARARTAGPLRFHTDRCDVVSLFCVRRAARGGESLIASSVAVSNAILARRPDLHALLCQDYHRNRQGEEAGGERQTYAMPVFAQRGGRFTSHYSRTFVEAAQLLPGIPRLTPAQDEALDLLAEVAEELAFRMTFEPGDIQLLNSHVTYHARAPYEDDPRPGRDRLLLRLWLAVANSRPLPEGFEVLWQSTVPGAPRGGVRQPAAVRSER
jgi:hypothetical protein